MKPPTVNGLWLWF